MVLTWSETKTTCNGKRGGEERNTYTHEIRETGDGSSVCCQSVWRSKLKRKRRVSLRESELQ